MKVKAEIRDLNYKKQIWPTIIPIIVEPLILLVVAAMLFGGDIDLPDWIKILVIALGIILYIVLIVRAFIKANESYNSSWETKEFDFYAQEGRLFLNGKPMHVNVFKSKKTIYVHDMGDGKNPYDATFYGTVTGDDYSNLLQFVEENGIKKEKEKLPTGTGKYGWASPAIVNKYRRK